MRLLHGIRSFPSARTQLWLSGWSSVSHRAGAKMCHERGSFLSLLSWKVGVCVEKIEVLSCVEHPLNKNFPTGPKKSSSVLHCDFWADSVDPAAYQGCIFIRAPKEVAKARLGPQESMYPCTTWAQDPMKEESPVKLLTSCLWWERQGWLPAWFQTSCKHNHAVCQQVTGWAGVGALLEASLRSCSLFFSDQGHFHTDNGTKRPPLPRVLMYGMVPLSRTWGPNAHKKKKKNSKQDCPITSIHSLPLSF